MPEYKYNLNRPAHLVANAVLRDVEAQANVKFINPQDTPVYAIVEAYAQKIDGLSYEKDVAEAALSKAKKQINELKAMMYEGMMRIRQTDDLSHKYDLEWVDRVADLILEVEGKKQGE